MNSRMNFINNFLWRFAERSGAQVVTIIVYIILSRVLNPEDFGRIAIVMVLTTIMQVFVDSGLGSALIQKKNADDVDFSSVFYFNIVICLLLYCIIFALAPMIAAFFKDGYLTPIIRTLGLIIIISGVQGIQQAYVSKNMLFKRFFFSTLGGAIVSAMIGITMAYEGYGIWALVLQQVSNPFVDTIILWITVKWRPKRLFSYSRLKSLLSYGWKLLVSYLLNTIYDNLRNLIIGKLYTPADLAYYNQGARFPSVLINNINSSIDSVLFPSMSSVQDNKERIMQITRRIIKTSTFIIAPMMMGLAFSAETIVELLLTSKWLPCVPFMRILCVSYMFYPIHTANLNAIKALGRSDIFLRLEIIKKIFGLVVLFISMWYGVMAMAYSLLLVSVVCQIINSWPNRKLLNYTYLQQLRDIFPSIFFSVVMGCTIYPIKFLAVSNLMIIVMQIVTGIWVYLSLSYLFKLEAFGYLIDLIKSKIQKERK